MKYTSYTILLVIFILTNFTHFSSAQSNSPATPKSLTATPVSLTQINLSWITPTSPIVTTGYRIFRDSKFIATTTAATYSDTALTASTTYVYTIDAFESHFNLSELSLPEATTTLAKPSVWFTAPIKSQRSSSRVTSKVLKMSPLNIVPNIDQAILTLTTSLPTVSTVSWGTTYEYESGTSADTSYDTNHKIILRGLVPGKTYYLYVTATDERGISVTSKTSFVTQVTFTSTPLPNPSDFTIQPTDNSLSIKWKNPEDIRFHNVRLIKSENFYPHDPFDGVLVYEGTDDKVTDFGSVNGNIYYYSIFSSDGKDLYSSGIIAKGNIAIPGNSRILLSSDPVVNTSPSNIFDATIDRLSINDFSFIQQGIELTAVNDGLIAIDGKENITVRIPYTQIPEVFKTILVTMTNIEDPKNIFSFMLRSNADKTTYEANVSPSDMSGYYNLRIAILDYQNQSLKVMHGGIRSLALASIGDLTSKSYSDIFGPLSVAVLVLVLLGALFVYYRNGRIVHESN